MNFGTLRNLIKGSDLQYLNSERRRTVLEKSTNLELESINKQVSSIFEGIDLGEYGKYRLFEYKDILTLSNLCQNAEQLKDLLYDPYLIYFIQYGDIWPIVDIGPIVSIAKNPKEFIDICSHILRIYGEKKVYGFRNNTVISLINLFNTTSDLIDALQNKKIQYLIKNANKENLDFILNKLEIICDNDLYKLLEHSAWEHIKKILRNGEIGDLEHLLSKQKGTNIVEDGSIIFTKEAKVGCCNDNENINKQILQGRKVKDVYKIYNDKEVIGYIKQLGEKSLLAIKDVYSEDGTLMLAKGMIYAVLNADDILGPLYLSKGDLIEINPIRMSELRNFDELVNYFLKTSNFNS